ncbi:uncharacterized protein [Triticum aestivum]|uniref:uncharacterized protein n=1 Tax=Triticum aestivum TaxID=4565 RepID=UPI001D02E93F|nr:uncharacterized protein LOC123188344 [Triticum aestivum]
MQAAVRTHQSPGARASSSPQSPVLRTSCAAARLEIQPRARLLRPPAAVGLEIQPRRRLKPLLASPGDTLRNGRSGEVVSRYFQRVLHAIGELRDDLIRKPSLETQTKIEGNYRWDPYFKDYVGAIDGKHVRASITPDMQPKQ